MFTGISPIYTLLINQIENKLFRIVNLFSIIAHIKYEFIVFQSSK